MQALPMPNASFGRAWMALALALGLHVADEALHDFLSVYNPTVFAIRQRLPWLPLPTFTFRVWLTGLILAVLLLLCLYPLALRRTRWVVLAAYPLGVLMTFNALQHFAGSLYLGRALPGVYSSPVLLAASLWLLAAARSRTLS
jgi:hypothetical protein